MEIHESLTVLVVEDDPLVRMDIVATIESAGFKTIEASNADEAVGLLSERDDIRVLVTDVEMPGSMDGVELAHYARAARRLGIVVTSGRRNIQAKDLPPGALFLAKPCRADDVVKHLHLVTTESFANKP